ncbi:MarR family protein [compost metagenome]
MADEFRLDISTVSRQTAALEQKGYVSRVPDPLDGRAYFLQITDAGLSELNENKKARLDRISNLLKSWPEEEQQQFGQLLLKFNRTFL